MTTATDQVANQEVVENDAHIGESIFARQASPIVSYLDPLAPQTPIPNPPVPDFSATNPRQAEPAHAIDRDSGTQATPVSESTAESFVYQDPAEDLDDDQPPASISLMDHLRSDNDDSDFRKAA